MSHNPPSSKLIRGGAFLIDDTKPEQTFIPEDFNEEQLMIKGMVTDYIEAEIWPVIDRLEKQEEGLMPSLIGKLAEQGLLGSHMPESFGGLQLDTNTNTLITEKLGGSLAAFTVAYAVQTGIGMLPILYFGSEKQKAEYLPKLISGEIIAAYCLTEPGSGSDALAAKTRADLTEDGNHYLINGQKMWISNAGFADLFVVFAQVDGDKFTGFLVHADSDGLSLGAEEHKLGIKGSSTRQVFFENVKVPKENLLGEIGKGHLIAFNALNTGRFKLHALSIGGCKMAMTDGIKYANERHQFKQPISNFGAIKYKIANCAIRTYAAESALYRVSQMLQDHSEASKDQGIVYGEAKRAAAEEYAIECALLKFTGSEALDYVVDEVLQIHGGMGYSEESAIARGYRDSRINRIYEGTNEINRLLSVDMLLRRGKNGAIDLVGPAWSVQKELASVPSLEPATGTYGEETRAVANFKKLILMVAGAAAKKQKDGELNLKEEQEILMNIADMLGDLLEAEALLLRLQKLEGRELEHPEAVYPAILKVYLHDANARMAKNATDAVASFAEGDLLRTFTMGIKRFTKYPPQNVKKLRRVVAEYLIEKNAYVL
ncbi:MAG: acyl-CoA dehydrogenase family protein [Bacteroidota bacterium]